MARFKRLDVYNRMMAVGVVPLFYQADVEKAKKIVTALSEGGATVIEFTNRGDHAYRVFTELAPYFEKALPEVILGVGSVLDAGTASMYLTAGANFVVGSVLNPDVAKVCNRRKVAYIPGCGTASEISNAEELGCELVKIFPADVLGGPKFVKSILAPTPWSNILPSGGVEPTRESLEGWFTAGVRVVGIGGNLVKADWIKTENYAAMTQLMAQTIQWIREIQEMGAK